MTPSGQNGRHEAHTARYASQATLMRYQALAASLRDYKRSDGRSAPIGDG